MPEEPVAVATEPVTEPAEPVAAAETTPAEPSNDLFAQLDALLPQDEPAAAEQTVNEPAAAQPNEALQPYLGISEFVASPEAIPQAIQAADEVWKVASGQVPARTLIQSIQQANPQAAEAIISDLRDFLGTSQQQADPFAAIKQANPQVFDAVAKFVKDNTGLDIAGAPDPLEQRLSELEQQAAQERYDRETAIVNAQVEKARSSAAEWLAKTTAGTFAEGLADRYIAPNGGLLWQKAQAMKISPETLTKELGQGKTETLEKIWKAVQKDEVAIIRKFNENLVKKQRALANGVPVAGVPAKPAAKWTPEFPAQLPGESTVDYGVRLMKLGKQ